MGQSEGDQLQLTQKEMPDPRTQHRQEHLFRQAEQYAGQSPFQQQYGYGSSMVPGMSGMSQTGQQYLTDRILGKGAYRVQDLGFSGYRRPDTATPGGYQYGQSGYISGEKFGDPSDPNYVFNLGTGQEQAWKRAYQDPSTWYNYMSAQVPDFQIMDEGQVVSAEDWSEMDRARQQQLFAQQGTPMERQSWGWGDPWGQQAPTGWDVAATSTAPASYGGLTAEQWAQRHGGVTGTPGTGTTGTWTPGTGTGTGTGGVGLGAQPGPKPGQPGYVRPGRDRSDWSPWMGETYEEGAIPADLGGINKPGYELNIWDTPDIPFGAQNLPTGPVYIEGLSRPWEESSAAQYAARGGDPSLTHKRYSGGKAIDTDYVPPTGGGLLQTDLGRPTAGVGISEVEDARTATRRMLLEQGRTGGLGYDRFLPGVEGIREGQQRRNSLGELMWESPGVPYLYTADDAVEAVPAGWQGISAPDYNQFMDVDPTTGEPADWQGLSKASGVSDLLSGGWQGIAPAGTGTAPGDPSISILGSQGITDPSAIGEQAISGISDENIAAVESEAYGAGDAVSAGGIANTEPNISGTLAVDPVTGEFLTADRLDPAIDGWLSTTPTTIAGPTDVTVDPLTGETTQDVSGVDPTEFTGASFLGGNLGAYMDVGGVDAQVKAAKLDYARAQNAEQARRAESLAWGTRGDIPRAEQETAMLARIAEIRRKGYTDAADRMEADLQRQQAAGMQSQQLAMQGGLQGQQLQAQRRESDAARAQQAAMQGQQLGLQADLQTQQLTQQGGVRGAELGLQSRMQTQQLEAQRREANAARAQQAALAGQQLDVGARMQEMQMGADRTQRKAELDLQAALANQQAALQSGSQDQQLEAQRAIRQAELDLQASQAQAGVDTDVALQQQQLEQQAGIRGAELEAQRQQRETELRLQRGMQTQQLGADAAAQQTQNEFARRQALATMGQDAATQQTQLEFARRQGLAEMGLTSAQQQSQNEFARRQELSRMGLQAQGMGMDDQARFREQQMALAQQLGRQGMDEQAATYAAAQQLQQMGATQEQRQQMQAAADYEQWLRSQEGFADEAAFLQAMQPQAGMAQYQRKPSVWGQVAGGLLSAGGAAATAFGSDARIKDNIEYVGMENGFKTYEFNYLGRDNRYRGVMAQEVMLERPDAVEIQDGFYRVNYDAIGVEFEAV